MPAGRAPAWAAAGRSRPGTGPPHSIGVTGNNKNTSCGWVDSAGGAVSLWPHNIPEQAGAITAACSPSALTSLSEVCRPLAKSPSTAAAKGRVRVGSRPQQHKQVVAKYGCQSGCSSSPIVVRFGVVQAQLPIPMLHSVLPAAASTPTSFICGTTYSSQQEIR
jgi:hypothetical protein